MTTIKDLATYANKQTINEISGTIKMAKEAETKQTKFGVLKTQSVWMEDSAGDDIWVTLQNKSTLSRLTQGQPIKLMSAEHKNGFGGVEVNKYHSEKYNEERISIKVNGHGHLMVGNEAANMVNNPVGTPDMEDVSGLKAGRGVPVRSGKSWDDLVSWVVVANNDPRLTECGFTEQQTWAAAFSAWKEGLPLPTDTGLTPGATLEHKPAEAFAKKVEKEIDFKSDDIPF